MIDAFQFATAGRIRFGAGRASGLAAEAAARGARPFLVTGSNPDRWRNITADLPVCGQHAQVGEPTIEDATNAAAAAREAGADLVIGLGGGSAVDLAKAVAALVPHAGPALRYLEVIGDGEPLDHTPLPCIAVPTTAGTGSEVTHNAVLRSDTHGVKVSLRHVAMAPDLALVDPELTHGLPPDLTAATGMDALVQLIEPFLSPFGTPITDALCRMAIPRAAAALPGAVADEPEARSDMALASLCSGIALSNAKLGVVHGIAGPLGGAIPVPHGVACARLLPGGLAANLEAAENASDRRTLDRLQEIATMVGTTDLVAWARELVHSLGVPPIGDVSAVADRVVAAAQRSSSMKGNPSRLPDERVGEILLGTA